MSRKKALEIADVTAVYRDKTSKKPDVALSHALYTSAKGTNHFYESLELIAECFPDSQYANEFSILKMSYE